MANRVFANRPNPTSGQQFNLFEDTSGGVSQGVAITGFDGEHLGIPDEPLIVKARVEDIVHYATGVVGEASAIINVGPTLLTHIRITLIPGGGQDLYGMMFDDVQVPADTTAPVWRSFIPRGGQIDETFDTGKEMSFQNGCVVCISTAVNQLELASPDAFIQTRRLT